MGQKFCPLVNMKLKPLKREKLSRMADGSFLIPRKLVPEKVGFDPQRN